MSLCHDGTGTETNHHRYVFVGKLSTSIRYYQPNVTNKSQLKCGN